MFFVNYVQNMTVVSYLLIFTLKLSNKFKENGCCFKAKNMQLFKDPNKVNRIPCSKKIIL